VAGQAQRGWRRRQITSRTDEQIGAQFGGEALHLQTYRAGRKKDLPGRSGDARVFKDGEKCLELPDFH
jgi:hypothetical protein